MMKARMLRLYKRESTNLQVYNTNLTKRRGLVELATSGHSRDGPISIGTTFRIDAIRDSDMCA